MQNNQVNFEEISGIQSKFEKYGDDFRTKLEALYVNPEDNRIHNHQVEAVLNTRKMLMTDEIQRPIGNQQEVRPAVIVAPTGSGKSGMIAMLPYILKAKRVLIITPSKVISRQIAIDFGWRIDQQSFFEKTRLIEDNRTLLRVLEIPSLIENRLDLNQRTANLVIINAQKFGGRSNTSLVHQNEEVVENVQTFFSQFDLLIVDEAHHYPARTWEIIVEEFRKPALGLVKKIVFLTATPVRSPNDAILPNLEQRTAFKISGNELVGLGLIRDANFIQLDNSELVVQHIMEYLNNPDAVENRFEHQAMVIVKNINEAQNLSNQLNNVRPNFAAAITSKSPDQLTTDFTNGGYSVAVVCGKLMEGYDNPKVSLCVILRPIRSQVLFTQFIGRCLRVNRDVLNNGMGIPDQTTSVVLSYSEFSQQGMWNARDEAANEDPVDEPEEII